MIKIMVPATSANLASGFDCFGLALDIYNSFEVELSDHDVLDNVEERFNKPDNMFLRAYHKGCAAMGIEDHVHVKFDCDIPVSRGMGSSAAMIVGGLYAAGVLHDNRLSKEDIFQLASEMEGHPDNAAPAVYGGFTVSCMDNGLFVTYPVSVDEGWCFTVLIPDFEVSTEKARKALPDAYERSVVANNGAREVYMMMALNKGDEQLLRLGVQDAIHQPYRQKLIHHYDEVKDMIGDKGTMIISGSGSTCLVIGKEYLPEDLEDKIKDTYNWQVQRVHVGSGVKKG